MLGHREEPFRAGGRAGVEHVGVGPGQPQRADARAAPRSREQGRVGDAADHQRLAVPLAGGGQGGDRLGHPRVGVLPGHAELGGEVVRAEREHVDPGDRRDLVARWRRRPGSRSGSRRRWRRRAPGSASPPGSAAGRTGAPWRAGSAGRGARTGRPGRRSAASAAVSTRGAMMPWAPPSSRRPIAPYSRSGMRTKGNRPRSCRGRAQAARRRQGHRRVLEVDHDGVVARWTWRSGRRRRVRLLRMASISIGSPPRSRSRNAFTRSVAPVTQGAGRARRRDRGR